MSNEEQKNQKNGSIWSDIPMRYKEKINEINDSVIKNIYSKFSYKYYEFKESKKEDEKSIINYLINYKFIIFHFTNLQNKGQNYLNNSKTDIVFCVEGECLIIEQIDKLLLHENILSKLEHISLINVGENPNHDFSQFESDAKEEIGNFCDHFAKVIKQNFFVLCTINSVIGYLIRRYYFLSDYFKDKSFFNFDQNNLTEQEIKRNLCNYIFGSEMKIDTVKKIKSDFNKIAQLENGFPKYIFEENDFIELKTITSKEKFSIYLAIHIKTLYVFCLKKFNNDLNANSHEINFSKYSHRCFVRCYGLLTNNNKKNIGLVYEFMCNDTLDSYIKNHEVDNFYLLMTIVRIFNGIEYLQNNHLIHRDLKPSNILIDHDYLPYISDFETIKTPSLKENFSTHDIGSLLYSSPEQNLSTNVSYPTDIYSFGCIVYFLFEKYYMLENFSEIINNKKIANAPKAIQNIYMECVKYKLEERITCDEIKMILIDILDFDYFAKHLLDIKFEFNIPKIINFMFEKLNLQRNESLILFYFKTIDEARVIFNIEYPYVFSLLFLYLGIDYEEGREVKQDYFKAIEYYEKSADLNNSTAFNKLGLIYMNGKGVKQDYSKAIKYFEKSADLDDLYALNKLGHIYANGKGVKQDYLIAIEYFKILANFNNPKGFNRLGLFYEEGMGVEQDYSKAIEYYKISADLKNSNPLNKLDIFHNEEEEEEVKQDYLKTIEYYKKSTDLNNSDTLYELGLIYEVGEGVKQNYSKAIEYFKRSADLNNSDALYNLGVFYARGDGVKQDYSKAIEYFEKSADLNNSAALYNLGLFYEEGIGVKQDFSKAIEYFKRSADLNNSDALGSLGLFYKEGIVVKQDYSKAIEYFEKSADLNNLNALNELGLIYEEGKGVSQNYLLAIEYYKKSANHNNSAALYNLGLFYEEGKGVKQDYLQAIEYYKKSANLNNSVALNKMGLIYKVGKGVKQDYSIAIDYFKKSASLNNSRAFINLGILYESGIGVDQNYMTALYYYERSSYLNNSDAFLNIGNFYLKGYGVNINYTKAIQNYEISSYLNNSKAHFILGDIFSDNDIIDLDLDKAIKYFLKSINIQTGLITTEYIDKTTFTEYKTNNYRYISYNDLGLIYMIEKKEIDEAIENIKKSAFEEYPFGQNNLGLVYEFYLNSKGDAEYMYERSSKHNFSLAEFNLGRMCESNEKIKESIEYYIRASEHEDEPLIYRGITREDKRLKISKKFIICLTNLKLFEYCLSNNDFNESKKYFIKAFNSFILNTKDLKYKFNFILRIQHENEEEYSNDIFLYLKKFIFNFPLFNFINQPNLNLKSYSYIFEQNKDNFKNEKNDEINPNIQEIKHLEKDNNLDEKEKEFSITNIDILEKERDCKTKQDELLSKLHSKVATEIINNVCANEYTVFFDQSIENKIEHNILFEDPGDLFDFVIINSNSKSKIKKMFIDEIKSIIKIMSKILYTPPYPILFGRLSIVSSKVKIEYNKRDIDESFYEGFGIEL